MEMKKLKTRQAILLGIELIIAIAAVIFLYFSFSQIG